MSVRITIKIVTFTRDVVWTHLTDSVMIRNIDTIIYWGPKEDERMMVSEKSSSPSASEVSGREYFLTVVVVSLSSWPGHQTNPTPEKAIQNNCNCLTFGSLKAKFSAAEDKALSSLSAFNGIRPELLCDVVSKQVISLDHSGAVEEQLKSPKNYFRWRS